MRCWVKCIVIVVVAAFAVASNLQIAQATVMDIQMSEPMEAGGGCADCPDGPEGSGPPCASDCVLSSVALPAADPANVSPVHVDALMPMRKTGLAGWRAPPDPFPPKCFS